jgi:hypothetical protein
MEACVGAHHLSRKLRGFGHDARLMPAKYVRPYSKGQKNDFRDAEAIAEAVQRPTTVWLAPRCRESNSAPDELGDLAARQTVNAHPSFGACGLATVWLAPRCLHNLDDKATGDTDVLLACAASNLRGLLERSTPDPMLERPVGHHDLQLSNLFRHAHLTA